MRRVVLKHVNTHHMGSRSSTHGLKEEQLTMNPAHRLPLSNACDHCAQSRHGSPQTYSVAMGDCAVLDALHGVFSLSLFGRSRAYLIEFEGEYLTMCDFRNKPESVNEAREC